MRFISSKRIPLQKFRMFKQTENFFTKSLFEFKNLCRAFSETFCANISMYEHFENFVPFLQQRQRQSTVESLDKYYMYILQNLTLANMAHNIIKIVHSTSVTQSTWIYVKSQ